MMGNELKLAGRSLFRGPGFTAVAVLTIALGVGASTAIFTIVRSVLLEATSVRRAGAARTVLDHLGRLSSRGDLRAGVFHYLDQNQVFRHIAIYRGRSSNLSVGNGDPEKVLICDATGHFFALLGVRPLLGRTLEPDDDDPGSARFAVARMSEVRSSDTVHALRLI